MGDVEDIWVRLTREIFPTPAKDVNQKTSPAAAGEDDVGEGGAEAAPAVTVPQASESHAVVVGQSSAGKSSVLNAYLNPNRDDVTPKPTAALDYVFARKSGNGAGSSLGPKDIAHIWELGGLGSPGSEEVSQLLSITMTPSTFENATYVVVLDLSRPSETVPALQAWTEQIKICVKACLRDLSKADPTFGEKLKRKTYAKFGRDHPDLRSIKPCPVPLVIIANKYDMFRDQDSVKRKVVAQALRFVAHLNGASLVFCCSREKQHRDTCRLFLNKHLFKSSASVSKRIMEVNPEKPIVIPAGADTFESILKATPGNTTAADFLGSNGSVADGAVAVWQQEIEYFFGPAAESDSAREKDREAEEMSSSTYAEAAVDDVRAQTEDNLRRYRKERTTVKKRVKR